MKRANSDQKLAASVAKLAKVEVPSKQNEVTLSEEQKYAINCIRKGENVWIEGPAGVGKSVVLKELSKLFDQDTFKITAPTVIAAANIPNATTIHRLMAIGIFPNAKTQKEFDDILLPVLKREHKKRYAWFNLGPKGCKIIAIDEAWMTTPVCFYVLHRLCQITNNSDKPFGGKQIILFGDPFQLPSVNDNREILDTSQPTVSSMFGLETKNKPNSELPFNRKFFFQTDLFRDSNFHIIRLTQNYRQKNDPTFFSLLQNIRIGNVTDEIDEILRSRVNLNPPDDAPRLFSEKKDAKEYNLNKLTTLPGETRHYDSWTKMVKIDFNRLNPYKPLETVLPEVHHDDEFMNVRREILKSAPIEETLELKVGARVMFTANIAPERGLFNGQLGHIEKIDDKGRVYFGYTFNGQKNVEKVQIHFWEKRYKPGVECRVYALPLINAWAVTFYKVQSATLDAVVIDTSSFNQYGMIYVGISRVRNIKDFYFLNYHRSCIKVHPDILKFYREHPVLCQAV